MDKIQENIWEKIVMPEIPPSAPLPHSRGLPNKGLVLVRLLDLASLAGAYEALWPLLSPDEQRRAARCLRPRQREQFVIVRAELRRMLGELLGVAPRRLEFAEGPHGKPHLRWPLLPKVAQNHNEAETLHGRKERPTFNIAHTEGFGLIAMACGLEIGIDVEAVRADKAVEKIAARFFSPREQAALRDLPESDRLRAFYVGWTRKEAVLKALGRGMTLPLRSFSVSLAPGEPPRLIEMQGDAGAPERWQIIDLPLPEPYVGALAAEAEQPLRIVD